MKKTEPLEWPNELRNTTGVRKVFTGLPIIGPDKAAKAKLDRQLSDREPLPVEVWSDERKHAIFKTIAQIIQEHCRWPNSNFVPEDPCEILFWNPSGDLRDVEAVLQILDHFRLPETLVDELRNMTLGDLVDRVACSR